MLSIAQLKEILHCSKQLTLLYVEDNKEARESMRLMLENFFDTILVANDGEDGLQKYEQYKLDTNSYIDIVITDIEMPKLDGIGLIKKIYKEENIDNFTEPTIRPVNAEFTLGTFAGLIKQSDENENDNK